MRKKIWTMAFGLMLAYALAASPRLSVAATQSQIEWQDWSAAVFTRAQKENKPILLNLEAVWCHWCHVMDQKTYSDPIVMAIIRDDFIAVKVDHDARPDLANRYRKFGWPATIFLNGDGEDLVKRAGYIAPQAFANLLRRIAENPQVDNSESRQQPAEFAESALLSEELRQELVARHYETFDWQRGGYRAKKKSMDRDSTEYSLARAALGDEREGRMARLTIDSSMALLDPEWGGVYQYSTRGDWLHPHFEKIMAVQAGYLRLYSLAYMQWREPQYLQAALETERYLTGFLGSPDGAFYTSQDADLIQGEKGAAFFALSSAERLARGMPRIDEHIYSRENGWAIEAITHLFQATGNEEFLDKAIRAADWIVSNRSLAGGGYRHSEADSGGPYLADTLNMGRAFLQLYSATGERRWLQLAVDAGAFIDATFRHDQAGFLSAATAVGPLEARANIDENVSATRFLNLLSHHTGDTDMRAAAEHSMRYLATSEVATRRIEEGGILLAGLELARDPAHFTVVGSKDDGGSRALFDVALRQPGWYKRLEWWDVEEGPLPNPDVQYPSFDDAVAFVCTNGRCSIPAFAAEQYEDLITRINSR